MPLATLEGTVTVAVAPPGMSAVSEVKPPSTCPLTNMPEAESLVAVCAKPSVFLKEMVAPAGTVSMSLTAQTKPFDSAVTSSAGDIWLASVNPSASFTPIVINPGQTATVNVTITPSAAAGTVVSGTLYVDDFSADVPPYAQTSGNELAGLPYSYKVGE